LRLAHDSALKDLQEEERSLAMQKELLEVQHGGLTAKVGELESEKKREVGQLQHEIKKLEEDIEGLRLKMRSKENNPFFAQVNVFFQEVSDYLGKYRALTQASADRALSKKEHFALQRKLADAEYSGQQRELAMKKQMDEQLRRHKEQLELKYEGRQLELEQERAKLGQLQERQGAFEQQLFASISQIQEAKERHMLLKDQRDTHRRLQVGAREVRLKEAQKQLGDMRTGQAQMEERIFKLSVENKEM
jgi:chromosome segregation ATPase